MLGKQEPYSKAMQIPHVRQSNGNLREKVQQKRVFWEAAVPCILCDAIMMEVDGHKHHHAPFTRTHADTTHHQPLIVLTSSPKNKPIGDLHDKMAPGWSGSLIQQIAARPPAAFVTSNDMPSTCHFFFPPPKTMATEPNAPLKKQSPDFWVLLLLLCC